MTSTNARDLATKAASRGDPEAIVLARAVDDPWFRCQALASVARYAADAKVEVIAREAIIAAKGDRDAYRTIAVRAWPIAALAERGLATTAQRLAEDAGYDSWRTDSSAGQT